MFQLLEAGHVTSKILVSISHEFPRTVECWVRNEDFEGLSEAVKPHLPVKESLPGGGVISRVLKPAKPARWKFMDTWVHSEDDAADMRQAGLEEQLHETSEPECEVWIAFGLECATKTEAEHRVRRTKASNMLVETKW